MLDLGGTATVIGMVPTSQKLEIRGMDLLSEKKLQGSMMGSNQFRVDMPNMVRMYLDGRLLLDEMVSATIPLEEINDGYDAMRRGEVARTVVTFPS
jgi:S-(hydroxymethyl)glutathione dehydrogenase/alcohol dehydrogenase